MSEIPLEEFVNLLTGERPADTGLPEEERAEARKQRLANGLQTLAGSVSSELRNEVGAFLGGQGALLENTRALVGKNSGTGVTAVTKMLVKTFNLPEPIAGLIAALLVKALPGVIGGSAKESTAAKPRKKKSASSTAKKPKTAKSSAGKKTTSQTKPKASVGARPKKTASGKETTSKPKATPKKPVKTARKKTSSRAEDIEVTPAD